MNPSFKMEARSNCPWNSLWVGKREGYFISVEGWFWANGLLKAKLMLKSKTVWWNVLWDFVLFPNRFRASEIWKCCVHVLRLSSCTLNAKGYVCLHVRSWCNGSVTPVAWAEIHRSAGRAAIYSFTGFGPDTRTAAVALAQSLLQLTELPCQLRKRLSKGICS